MSELIYEKIEVDIFKSFMEGDPQISKKFLIKYPKLRSQVISTLITDCYSHASDLHTIEPLVQHPPSLMFVEDDPDLQALYHQMFKNSSFTIITHAADGRTAISLYKELLDRDKKPTLILLDYNLPLLSGLEVALHIRSLDPSQPILFLTANAKVLHLCSLYDSLRNIPVLAKPCASKKLISAIAKLLNK